jgi:hypothetical protein
MHRSNLSFFPEPKECIQTINPSEFKIIQKLTTIPGIFCKPWKEAFFGFDMALVCFKKCSVLPWSYLISHILQSENVIH